MKKFNKNLIVAVLAIASVAFGMIGSAPVFAATATVPPLGSMASFSVLGAAAMSSANNTTISGDLGLSPGLLVSKTGTWTHTGGSEYFGVGGLSATAQADALVAFNNLKSQTTSGIWASASPSPGVWTIALDTTFAGPTLTLSGDYNDVWVFQIGRGMTFNGSVVLAGNAQACNVFWQIGGDATIATGSNFVGTLIAQNDITSTSGSVINGRLISLTGTTLAMSGADSSISGPTCLSAPAPISGLSRYGKINVVKTVINDNGGTKTVADFPLFVNSSPVISGVTNDFPAPGSAYTITETGDSNYTRTFSGDCAGDGKVAINPGDNKFCIITNNDIGAPVVVPPVPPLIEVVKVPSPLALPAGPGLVEYTYTLRNIGTVPVSLVTMVGDTCSPIVLISGDTNKNTQLDVNETWVHTCSTTLSATHTNTVVATGWANGISATDIASATVVVGAPIVPPLVHLVKVPSVFTLPAPGGAVTYTYTVTNPGTAPLSDVSLSDDKCTGLPSRVLGHPGDLNKNNLLESSETWSFTCQSNLTETTTNTGTVQGSANGLTARDFAIATVVVSAVVPKLPNAGLYPENKDASRNTILLFGVLVSAFVLIILKKRTI